MFYTTGVSHVNKNTRLQVYNGQPKTFRQVELPHLYHECVPKVGILQCCYAATTYVDKKHNASLYEPDIHSYVQHFKTTTADAKCCINKGNDDDDFV